MDRQLAKHHAAARLRRQIEGQEAARHIEAEIRASYIRGHRNGKDHANAVAISTLPGDLIAEVKAHLCDQLAADLARSAFDQLQPEAAYALRRLAQEFVKTFQWSLPVHDPATMRAFMEHHMDRMEFRISLPPMNAAMTIDRLQIAMRRRT